MKKSFIGTLVRGPRGVPLIVIAVVAAGALTACSDGKQREYAVPDSLCGAKVSADLLSPFLPPGSQVSVEDTTPFEGKRRCNVSVDGELAVVASREWWKKDERITKVAVAHKDMKLEKSETSGNYLYSGNGAVGRTEGCTDADFKGQSMFTAVEVYASGLDDAKSMKGLIADYTASVEKSTECTDA
ncbi:hypothetical protein HRW18_23420 [Streptomyces lunaelactis]|uniref:hypothetical protein n=1 Tax=Streptomyces lunaelactis TaxID=1535768 RepID=UPI0015848ADC|nr:hypothetical protein [Streptomyces lunaelactis]NUK10881.1 hypothetical protein [Streptomyces lunaelactis]NUK37277.1 hypothetical protein [Streptomyces lunaelactis]NUK43947.1 hypothetical protein [Streptomyces lunaelactis]NUK53419.1 hypothetical protein [Streptomyces lunaelactis]NUK67106.1 hypothetical protein [Streptomyces lunaelactis]